jgi:hypothetical protein
VGLRKLKDAIKRARSPNPSPQALPVREQESSGPKETDTMSAEDDKPGHLKGGSSNPNEERPSSSKESTTGQTAGERILSTMGPKRSQG